MEINKQNTNNQNTNNQESNKQKKKEEIVKYATDTKTGFHGKSALLKKFGKENEKIIDKIFEEKEEFNLFQRRRKKFNRRPIQSRGLNYQWQVDLMDMQNLAEHNEGMRYLLIVIDVFSRFVWVVPLRRKTASYVVEGFEKIFSMTEARPGLIQYDEGKEFVNNQVKEFFRENTIKVFHVYSDQKAAIAERFIRTLRGMITRYLHHKHTLKYIDVLDKLIENYNNTYHTSIGIKPSEVSEENEEEVKRSYDSKIKKKIDNLSKPIRIFTEGDTVRISREKGIFEKEQDNNYSLEIFRVKEVKNTKPVMYSLEALDGEMIKGSFYPEEMVKTELPETFRISRIVRYRRLSDGTREALVYWEGYPEPTWTRADWITDIEQPSQTGSGIVNQLIKQVKK